MKRLLETILVLVCGGGLHFFISRPALTALLTRDLQICLPILLWFLALLLLIGIWEKPPGPTP